MMVIVSVPVRVVMVIRWIIPVIVRRIPAVIIIRIIGIISRIIIIVTPVQRKTPATVIRIVPVVIAKERIVIIKTC
jgi:hypothetical protein